MFSYNLLANGAHKAGWMVGLSQDGHHLSLHKFPTVVAECAVKPLEVQRAEVVTIPHKEATLCQVTATDCTHREKGMKRFDNNIKNNIII